MKKRTLALILLSLILSIGTLKAQSSVNSTFTITINGLSLIRIYPLSTTIAMTLLTNNAGESMLPKTDATTYLQLTSIAPLNQTRRITAIISSGTVPGGTLLKVTPAACTNVGGGSFGTPSSQLTLNKTSSQTLINGIRSGFTGSGITNGFKLTYTFMADPANYNKLYRTSVNTIIVTYTMVVN